MNNIVSLSGGKDSTAMLHMMLERGEDIHSVVFFDTGWEFPQMHDHINLVEKKTGLKVWRLHPRIPFEYRMLYRKVISKDKSVKYGYAWPSNIRWCTRQKLRTIDFFSNRIDDAIQCVGYAVDEIDRKIKEDKRYPLIEYGITEKHALKYCQEIGYHWGGLYEYFDRVSCYCCPQKSIPELKKIRKHFPGLWVEMLRLDALQPGHGVGFKNGKNLQHWEKRFAQEDKQKTLPGFDRGLN